MTDRRNLGAAPLSEIAVASYNPDESVEYDAFNDQSGKLQTEGPAAVDWTLLIRAGENILRNEAKDIKVAAYYAFALYRRERFVGLADALTVIRDSVRHHWDIMQPKRIPVRTRHLEWLSEKLAGLLPEKVPTGDDGAALEACRTLIEEITAAMLVHDTRPGWDEGFIRHITYLSNERRKAAAAPPPPPAPPPDAAPALAPEPSPSVPPPPQPSVAPPIDLQVETASVAQGADLSQVEKALEKTTQGARAVARELLRLRPSDPRAYQALRFANWAALTRPPPHKDGKTPLTSPPPDRIKALNDMVQAGRFLDAVQEVEKSFSNAPFWLDAHRLTATALAGLGGEYAAARTAVVGALADLLRRFAILPELSFQNGPPFADPMTRAWITGEVLAQEAGGGEKAVWDIAADEARELAGKGDIANAAALFVQGRRQADGERSRLMWELAQARFCLEIGRPLVAASILEAIDDRIEAQGVETWEPAAVVETTRLLLDSYRRFPPPAAPPPGQPPKPRPPADEARRTRADNLRARLARLDVGQALTLADN